MADDLLDFRRPFDADGLIVNGKRFDADLTASLTAARIEMTMEGPSVLTLEALDPNHGLLRSGVLGKKWNATVEIAGVSFTLSELEKTQGGCRIVFYDTAAARLKRKKHGAVKMSRNRVTRAQLLHSMAQSAGVRFASPDEHSRQPIEPFTREEETTLRENRPRATDLATTPPAKASRRETSGVSGDAGIGGAGGVGGTTSQPAARKRKPGLFGKNITIKGVAASSEQLRHIHTVMTVAERVGAFPDKPLATKAALVAAIGESGFQAIPNDGGSNYHGVFQGNKGVFSIGDTEGMATYFFRGGKGYQGGGALEQARRYPNKSPGHIALTVEGSVSNFPSVAAGIEHYDKWGSEADRIMAAWSPGDDDDSLGDLAARVGRADRSYVKPYEFRVEENESYWEAGVRLAEEVGWRFFAVGNRIWYASDLTLARATPLMVVREGDEGIDSVLWSVDEGGHITEMTVKCRLRAWSAAPGNVVVVEDEAPQANGRWLVRSIERDLLDTGGVAAITLGKPVDPKLEPRSSIAQVAGTDPADDTPDDTKPASSRPASGGSPLLGYPLAKHGSNLGGVAAHRARAWGNWQSDNAVDIGVPQGVDVFAVADGTITKLGGAWRGGSGNPDGYHITLQAADNTWWYTHLRFRSARVRVGASVSRGDYLGKSGAANGVPHLHIASEHGDPEQLLGV